MPMTGNKCLLDTSVIIHSFKNRNDISEKLNSFIELHVPIIVAGELLYGAYKSGDVPRHLAVVQVFLKSCKIVMPDLNTADVYAVVKTKLAKKGKPIPENDIWIAAFAIQKNLPLFTTDNHFGEVDGLILL